MNETQWYDLMTKEEAFQILNVSNTESIDAIRQKYERVYSDLQVNLTNAPTDNLKRVYQNELEQLEKIPKVLNFPLQEETAHMLPSSKPTESHQLERNKKRLLNQEEISLEQAFQILGISWDSWSKEELNVKYEKLKQEFQLSIQNETLQSVKNGYQEALIKLENAYELVNKERPKNETGAESIKTENDFKEVKPKSNRRTILIGATIIGVAAISLIIFLRGSILGGTETIEGATSVEVKGGVGDAWNEIEDQLKEVELTIVTKNLEQDEDKDIGYYSIESWMVNGNKIREQTGHHFYEGDRIVVDLKWNFKAEFIARKRAELAEMKSTIEQCRYTETGVNYGVESYFNVQFKETKLYIKEFHVSNKEEDVDLAHGWYIPYEDMQGFQYDEIERKRNDKDDTFYSVRIKPINKFPCYLSELENTEQTCSYFTIKSSNKNHLKDVLAAIEDWSKYPYVPNNTMK